VFLPFCHVVLGQNVHDQKRPNIILIMSDDMGYSDIGCYGSEIETPNLDALAANGLRYTSFYNQARSCPTRASLMTGLYPHQAGMGWMSAVDHHLPGYQGQLNESCVTIAQVLKSSGYSTYMSGKWHLQYDQNTKQDSPKYDWPLQRGFDKFYGMLVGAGSYFDPATLCRENTLITPFTDPDYNPEHFYFTDAITDNALSFIRDDKGDNPFFLYVAYTAAHWPMHAPDDAISKYKGNYDEGWEVVRQRRLVKMKELGILGPRVDLSPMATIMWEQEPDKPAMARRMETYAAMIDIMDQGIGKIVEELKRKGVYENTIILFLQDNGGCAEGIGFGGQQGEKMPAARDTTGLKPLGKEDLQTAVIPLYNRKGQVMMGGKNVMAGPDDTYVAYLKPWAIVSNTPFKKFKKYVHEGGISTPLIVQWPAGIKGKGETRGQVGSVIDIMPTLVELAEAKYPEVLDGREITPLQGISLVPSLTNRQMSSRTIFWEHEMNRAVREGKWKLVSTGRLLNGGYGYWKNYQEGKWELYDMEEDRSELTDLSGQYPEKVLKMSKLWEEWAETVHVFPSPWKEIAPPFRSAYAD
jgi:arylsulfatase A-like enzyme